MSAAPTLTHARLDLPTEALRAARQHLVMRYGRPLGARRFLGGALPMLEVAVFGKSPSPTVFASAGAPQVWTLLAKRGPAVFGAGGNEGSGAPLHAPLSDLVARVATANPAIGRVIDIPREIVATGALADLRAAALFPAWTLPEQHRAFVQRDGVRVELGWIVPVSDLEAAFARGQSLDALWQRFAARRVDLFDLTRAGLRLDE
jgi:hypothetical protein